MEVTNAHISSSALVFTVVESGKVYMVCFDHNRENLTRLRIGNRTKDVFIMSLESPPNKCQVSLADLEQYVAGKCWEAVISFLKDSQALIHSLDPTVSELQSFRKFVKNGAAYIKRLLNNNMTVNNS